MKKKYRVREGSIAWYVQKTWKPVAVLASAGLIIGGMVVAQIALAAEEPLEPVEPVAIVLDELPEPETWDVPLEKDLQLFIADLCEEMSIEPELVLAMIEQESQWNPEAVGDGGNSLGLLQIQPRWHSARMDKLGCTDLFNPYENVKVAIDILAEKMAAGKGTEWALMAYNGGNAYANSLKAQGKVSGYAKEVLARAEELKAGDI